MQSSNTATAGPSDKFVFSSMARKDSTRLTSLSAKLNNRKSDIVASGCPGEIPAVPALRSSTSGLEAKAASNMLFRNDTGANTIEVASNDEDYDDVSTHEGFANLVSLTKPGSKLGPKPVDTIKLSKSQSMPMIRGRARTVTYKSSVTGSSTSLPVSSSSSSKSRRASTFSTPASTLAEDEEATFDTKTLPAPRGPPPAPLPPPLPPTPSLPPPSLPEPYRPASPPPGRRTHGSRPGPVTQVVGLETLNFEVSAISLIPATHLRPRTTNPPTPLPTKKPQRKTLCKKFSQVFHCRKASTATPLPAPRHVISAPMKVYLGTGVEKAPLKTIAKPALELAAAARGTQKPVPSEGWAWVAYEGKGAPVKFVRATSLKEGDKGHPHPLKSAGI